MIRIIEDKLLEWKNNPLRKPLIIRGVRQVGKTYTIKEFGEKTYKNFYRYWIDEHGLRVKREQ